MLAGEQSIGQTWKGNAKLKVQYENHTAKSAARELKETVRSTRVSMRARKKPKTDFEL